MVGDDDQTIYQFRGSNAENMISFSERYANVHQVRLQKNFRCAPGIVDVADCVIAHNERRINKNMISGDLDGLADIRAEGYPGKTEQFEAIAERIAVLNRAGIPYHEMAVLVRKGKVIAPVSAALNRAGIPVETDSAEHFFAGGYFHRFVTTLQILADVDKSKLYECWGNLVDHTAFNLGFRFLRSCSRNYHLRLGEIIHGFCEKIGFLDEGVEDLDIRRIDLEGIIKILDDYDEIYADWQISARIAGVLRFLATQAAEEYKHHSFKPKDPNANAVQIMTVHKAKGLEFHTVFLPELNKREFPVSNMGGKQYWHVLSGVFKEKKDKYKSDLEDERKLFYVAVTRAKRNLYMSYELTGQPVSCFVKEAAISHHVIVDRNVFRHDSVSTVEDVHQQQEYWATVKYARSQLYDYYGTASHFFPAAHTDLVRIKSMTPEEILCEASKNGLI